MEVGIGLPNAVPGLSGRRLPDWAARAEERGFATLGTIDRVVYPSYESLIALAAAAAVTERVRLFTDILISPPRHTALLAKQAATLDSLSGGRLVLGLAVGWRDDDYRIAGVDFEERGRVFDQQLEQLRGIWAGESVDGLGSIGPDSVQRGGPELLIGGGVKAAYRRAARYGSGWTMGGGTPNQFREGKAATEEAWREHGREGRPRTSVLAYFSLGPNGQEKAHHYIHHYYAPMGEEIAEMIAQSVATDEDTVSGYSQAFGDLGADELVWFPCSDDLEQIDLLADAVRDRLA